ncbi:MAG: hypothetical protein TREMPRED_004989 [Tremellales sp. Tagirdzhanova-0007]|nr:MAG: hypothetical protein TREMPRED_004989 [Tremellales sp. Tagirdzhanova-0007]
MSYTIAGMVVKNEYLALGTICTAIGGYLATSGGGDKNATTKGPVPVTEDHSITADSKDEEDFIRQFVAEAEKEDKGH